MAEKAVWKRSAPALALLAVASFVVPAREVDFSKPDADSLVVKPVDPADYRNLDGVWWCHFLTFKGEIEQTYYSVWTFNQKAHQVDIFFSPVHKGFVYDYRWDGKQLILDHAWGPSPRLNFATYKTQMRAGATLVIENPRLRWKGWYCNHQPAERWPADALQFLDYTRYPWLSGLVEDSREIEKYRNPKRYEE